MSLDEPIPFRLCSNIGNPVINRTEFIQPSWFLRSRNKYGHYKKHSGRNNPQPLYVKHFSGLQNAPICRVADSDYSRAKSAPPSFNTLTGLPIIRLRDIPPMEKAIPLQGMITQREPWRQELKALTESVLQNVMPLECYGNIIEYHPYPICRPVTAYMESAASVMASLSGRESVQSRNGNLVNRETIHSRQGTASSRRSTASSRHSRARRPHTSRLDLEKLIWNDSWSTDYESQVLSLLCQLLNLENINKVKSWLAHASDRDKASIISILETIFQSRLQTDEQKNDGNTEEFGELLEDLKEEDEEKDQFEDHKETQKEPENMFEEKTDILDLDRISPNKTPSSFLPPLEDIRKINRPKTISSKIRPMTSMSVSSEVREAPRSTDTVEEVQNTVQESNKPRILLRYKTSAFKSINEKARDEFMRDLEF